MVSTAKFPVFVPGQRGPPPLRAGPDRRRRQGGHALCAQWTCAALDSAATLPAHVILIHIKYIFLGYGFRSEDEVTDTPLAADQLVRDCPEKQAAVAWPLPVDARLDELLAQAEAAGENTSRKELVAAIIALTTVTDAQLGRLLRRYRRAKVRDLISLPEGENVVPFMKHKPGPRTFSSWQPR
jgi:hypothetical protein